MPRRSYLLLFALIAVVGLAGIFTADRLNPKPKAVSAVLFNGDFETGNLTQFNPTYCAHSWSCSVVPAPAPHTGLAGRFETDANESGPLGTCCVWDQVQVSSNETSGTESFWHWELYLPAGFTDSASFWQNLVEWHHFQTGSTTICNCPHSPPLSIQEINGRFIVRIVNDNVEADSAAWTQFDLGPAPRGAWSTFDFHAKWSADPTVAVTEITVNGVKKTITGHPNEFTGYFNFFLAGWYHAAVSAPASQVLFYDNIRRTLTADVPTTTTSSTTVPTTSTLTTTTSPTTTTSSAVEWVRIQTPATGATKATAPRTVGSVIWEATLNAGAQPSRVEFRIDSQLGGKHLNNLWTEHGAPYRYNGDTGFLDTRTLSNGTHRLGVRAYRPDGTYAAVTGWINVQN